MAGRTSGVGLRLSLDNGAEQRIHLSKIDNEPHEPQADAAHNDGQPIQRRIVGPVYKNFLEREAGEMSEMPSRK